MIWAIDIDGVITANPEVFKWLTYHLSKNENDNKIYIISWRNGQDVERYTQTLEELGLFGITYDMLITAPRKFKNLRTAAFWKIKMMRELKVDIWFDDEIKSYRRDLGINLDALLPDVNKIWI